MERHDLEIVTTGDLRRLYMNIRRTLICGYFNQVAHKGGDKGMYQTMGDDQVRVLKAFIT